MSPLSSRYWWRKCYYRRLYSSSTAESTQPQLRRTPIASDFGGVPIDPSGSRFPKQTRRTKPLDLREFKHGTLSGQLAARELQQRQQNQQSQNGTEGHSSPSHPRSSRMVDTTNSSRQDGAYVRSRQPRQRLVVDNTDLSKQDAGHVQARYPRERQRIGSMDMHQNEQYSDRRVARVQRRSQPLQNEYDKEGEVEIYEEMEETDAIDDDIGATKTSFKLRRPDFPLAPRGPQLPPSLTMLEQKIYIDTPTKELIERQGGDYARYFSPDEWKIVRAQSSTPPSVIDYAQLALHLNRTVPVTQRKEGIEIVRKHVEKADAIATAP